MVKGKDFEMDGGLSKRTTSGPIGPLMAKQGVKGLTCHSMEN